MAKNLLKLEMNKPKLYVFLNVLADVLVKPIPIFIWMLLNPSLFRTGENAVQNVNIGIIIVIGTYLGAIIFYGMILLIIQMFKLSFCKYKPIVIHIRIFDIIIKLSARSIRNGDDMELRNLLYEHEMIIRNRKDKRNQKISDAYHKKRQKDIEELEYANKNYADYKDRAYRHRRNAKAEFEHARNGVFFTESSRESGKRDLKNASYEEKMAAQELERIRAKERALGIKQED